MKKVILVFSLFILGTGISLAEKDKYTMNDDFCGQYTMWSGCEAISSICRINAVNDCIVSNQVSCAELCGGGV